MTLNEGKYSCEASNSQGKDELAYGVHIVPFNNNNFIESNKITPAASSDSQISSFSKNKSDANESKFWCNEAFFEGPSKAFFLMSVLALQAAITYYLA